jgi:NTE family protein
MGRIGLVLGAGGVVGHAFHAGVLAALERSTGWAPDAAGVIVGTSAGSIVAALVRAGAPAADIAGASLGRELSPAGRAVYERIGRRAGLPRPGLQHADLRRGPAAPGLLLRPWGVRPGTLGAAMLPAGRVPSEQLAAGVRNVYGSGWPGRPTWICAVGLDDGRLVVFGRDGSPPASLADAVAASCAIPAFLTPVLIGGVRYVDGGVHSATNADQLRDAGLDLVVVSCPMGLAPEAVTYGLDVPVRVATTMRLAREVAILRRRGTEAVSFLPGRADRAAMGGNPLDPRRSAPVTKQAYESTLARLEDPSVRQRLAALG